MRSRSPLVRIWLAATVLLGPWPGSVAFACACCAEPGQRYESSDTISSSLREEIAGVQFAPTAVLYSDAGFPDSVKGVRAPSEKAYRVTLTRPGGLFVFDVIDPSGKAGRITFALPQRVSRLEVDPRNQGKPGGTGAALYKEWRLESPATLTGIFAVSQQRATARLILHGRGNSCTSSADFTHWTLAVSGGGVRFTLLGEIKP